MPIGFFGNRSHRGFPGGSDGKESAFNAGDLGSIRAWRRSPGEGNGNLLQVFLPGELHGQKRVTDYNPWVAKSQVRLSD